MSKFLTDLVIKALHPEELREIAEDHAWFRLMEDFVYESALLGCEVKVPAGFMTDFASIPGGAKFYLDDDAPGVLYPSVVHDYLYSMKGLLGRDGRYTRQIADAVLREAMLLCGARWAQAQVVYLAVRMGGGSHWKS